MGLDCSQVHRNLDGQLKIMGLEAPDLILVLMIAAIMNLFFGETRLMLLMVFGLPSLLLAVLYFGKKDKPENYLIHLAKYLTTPGFYSAGVLATNETKMKKRFYE